MKHNTNYKRKKGNKSKIFIKLLALLAFAVIVIVVYSAFLVSVSNSEEEYKYVFGLKLYAIETNSMEPELKVGDVIIIKQCNKEDLKISDIITFKSRGELITHRIADIDEKNQKYSTKGDKNTLNDIEKIKFSDIEGKMVYKLPGFLRTLKVSKIVMCIFLIFVIVITIFLHSNRQNRKSKIRRMKKKDEDKRARIYEETDSNI